MEQDDNVQVVQDLYAAFGRGDLPGLLALLDENVDWHFNGRPQDIPFAGRWQGHIRIVDLFRTIDLNCDVLEFGPDEVLIFDNHVLSLGYERVRVKATGREFETNWAHLFTLKDGRVVRLREFYDTAAMANALRTD
ncbi:MAG: nuclear transport factor 2 family protein [Candidatus Promineifilaceae bacterium]